METNERKRVSSPVRRLSKILFTLLGGVAILLAVALGVFRLLVAQIPEYQEEIKAWVAAELGLTVEFSVLDARLGLTGPELTLSDTSIGSGEEFLQADRATITLDPVVLILSRRIDISRLTLDGVLLTVERDAGGALRLGDLPLASGSDSIERSIPEAVQVAIRNSELRFVDVRRAEDWTFSDLDIVIDSEGGNYLAVASVSPPVDLAQRFDFGFRFSLPDGAETMTLAIDAEAEGVDFESLSHLLELDGLPPLGGAGNLEAEIRWDDGELAELRIGVDAGTVALGDAEPFERLGLVADWQRTGDGDWRLALDNIDVRRSDRVWEPSGSAVFSLTSGRAGWESVSLVFDFLRLEDVQAIVEAFPETQLAEQWALFEPVGDIRDLRFSLEQRGSAVDYDLDAVFERIAVRQVGSTPGLSGISGSVQATEDSGTIQFGTEEFSIDWPSLLRQRIDGDSIDGNVVWRQGRDIVQVLSVDLSVGALGREARTSFDLKLPRDSSSPTLDLEAELASAELVPAKQFLPTGIMPEAVVDWLDRAIVGGEARDIELTFFGPVRAFPFDEGEGQFRVVADIENAVLDYMDGWPEGTDIDGRVEFVNAGFRASASGEALGNRTEDFELSIADMRNATLEMSFAAEGTLANIVDYLRAVPLIADRLGPGFERIGVSDGAGSLRADIVLPLLDRSAFSLDAALGMEDGSLTVRGLTPAFTEINGVMTAQKDTVSADGIEAVFLGGPIAVSLRRADEPGYRAELAFDGETSVRALAASFNLPPFGFLDGQALWNGRLLLPALDPLATRQPRISIASNLAGVAIRLPEPLAKAPGQPVNLALDLRFASGNRLEVTGNLGATRRFALGFSVGADSLVFEQGAVEFGGQEPRLPVQPGFLVGGQVEEIELDRWLDLGSTTGIGRAGPLFLGANIETASFNAFGQQLGTTSLRVARGDDDWQIDIDSEAVAGTISIPREELRRNSVIASMRRVYLAAPGESEGGLSTLDPRTLPGIRMEAAEFGFGNRQLGEVTAVVRPDPSGLALSEFRSRTENFQTEITGSWLVRAGGPRTTIDATIRSTDVAAALDELGLDPAIEGESAEVSARVFWDSAPTGAWLDHLNGDVSLLVETGTLREIDPGAGRMLGLMSIAALPRRLALDFRDVFEEGFAFDEITGNFRLIDGNAYTNDLKFGGPAAEIGVVGRTGLRDRDYRQQIVVAPEPGNMLPTVGGILGGAGVGAALLIFTRLFKEPLKGIGRASYCLTGSWEAPTVTPIEDDESAEAARCAELPDEMRPVDD